MSYTLILIDLQTGFIDEIVDNKKVLANARKAVKKAISDNMPIIMVEYRGSGSTVDCIFNLVKNYKKHYLVEKVGCDGSIDIIKFLLHTPTRLPLKKIRAAGIYSHECLQETIESLMDYFDDTEFQIIEPACGAGSIYDHEKGMYSLETNGAKIVKS